LFFFQNVSVAIHECTVYLEEIIVLEDCQLRMLDPAIRPWTPADSSHICHKKWIIHFIRT